MSFDEKEFLEAIKKFKESKADLVERREGERRKPVIVIVDRHDQRKADRRGKE